MPSVAAAVVTVAVGAVVAVTGSGSAVTGAVTGAAGAFVAGIVGNIAGDGALRSRADRARSGLAGIVSALVTRAAGRWADEPAVGAGRAMRVAARLMPPAVGKRWLGEAESFLSEVAPARRAKVTRNYLAAAPQVITAGWAAELARRATARRS
jgi:hypothetical protein